MKKVEIQILDELKSLISPLHQTEFDQLEKNILAEGILETIKVWKHDNNYVLIDGHNRFAIAQKHQIDFKIDILEFEDLAAAKKWMINFQLGRRNLTSEQSSYLRGILYNQFKQDATQNILQKPHLNENDSNGHFVRSTEYNRKVLIQNNDNVSIENNKTTSEILSEKYNVSEKTIRRDGQFAEGLDKLDDELKADILAGNTKINKSDIQKLAQLELADKIDTLDDVHNLLETVASEKKKVKTDSEIEIQPTKGKLTTKQAFEIVIRGDFVKEICLKKVSFIAKMSTEPSFKVFKEVTVRIPTEEKTRFGKDKPQRRRFDAILLVKPYYKAWGGELFSIGIEIKVSKSDLKQDSKFQEYLEFTNYMFFAVPHELIELALEKCKDFDKVGVINLEDSSIVKMPTCQDVPVQNSEALLREIAFLH